MGTSLKLFHIKGIDVRVHWSFVLILVYGAFAYSQGPAGVVLGAIYGVVAILLLFVCVTLHEFGHALVAQYYEVHVKSIMLFPIGGVANLERIPEKPIQEFLIAIAGPLVNFALAFILLPFVIIGVAMQVRSGNGPNGILELLADAQTPGIVNLLVYLLLMNLMLALFNLLPAFPMDGGRILRSLLAMTMNYVKATRVAVTVGRMVAILLAIWGIFLWSTGGGGIFLLLIAFFVYVGGGAEREAVESRAILRNFAAHDALTHGAANFYVTDRLQKAADQLMASYQTDYPVMDLGGQFAGVLTRPGLIRALEEYGPDGRVVDAMLPAAQVPICKPGADLVSVWEQMSVSGLRVVAVKDGADFLGLITIDDITEVVHVMGAAANSRRVSSPTNTPPDLDGKSVDA
jgi:Zn-dependent protease